MFLPTILPEIPLLENFISRSIKLMNAQKLLDLINDVFISNYWDKKQGNTVLIGIDDINRLASHFRSFKLEGIPHIKGKSINYNPADIGSMNYLVKDRYSIIYDILQMSKGKLSLCGGALTSLFMHNTTGCDPNDFDFFFHDVTVEEADDILRKCMNYIDNIEDTEVTYNVSQGVYTAHIYLDVGVYHDSPNYVTVQFIRRIYESKDQVLLGFDLAPSRFGYNLRDGLFSTLCGAVSLAIKAFPLDLSQRSLSYNNRLSKYKIKGFSILLIGLPSGVEGNLITPDGIIRNENNDRFTLEHKVDKIEDYSDLSVIIWETIANDRCHNVTFSSLKLQDIYDLPDDVIEGNINNNEYFTFKVENLRQLDPDGAIKFLREKYEEFAMAFYVKRDFNEANRLWRKRCDYYIQRTKEIAKFNKDNPWIIVNTMNQNFGQFNPAVVHPREWYGENYKPTVIGINMERMQAFMDCRKNIEFMQVPNEIFKLLCYFWLRAEVCDARQRLFAIGK